MNEQAAKEFLDQKLKTLITELTHEELVEKYLTLLKKFGELKRSISGDNNE